MNIINSRFDDRLVHGCVATLWIPKLDIERVICIDDASAADQVSKSILRMATPKKCALSVISTETAIENLKADKYGEQRVLIVTKTPQVFQKLVENGIQIPELVLGNLGNINRNKSSVKINRFVTVDDDDFVCLKALHDSGAKLITQLEPDSPRDEDFYNTMAKARN